MWFLALRQLAARPQQTLLTFVAIILGTMGYVVFSAMIMGMREFLTDQLINADGQIRISPRDELKTPESFRGVFFADAQVFWIKPPAGRYDANRLSSRALWERRLDQAPEALAYAPQLNRQVFVLHNDETLSVRMTGIEPEVQRLVSNIEKHIEHGRLTDLSGAGAAVIAGGALLDRLGLRPGDNLMIAAPRREAQPVKIKGVFRTGNRTLDESVVYAALSTVQRITASSGEVSDIVVKVRDPMAAADLADQWSQFSRDKVQSWDQANSQIFEIFRSQDIFFNSITGIILLIVAFGIYNILNMVVTQKKREIAILKSFGFDERDIMQLFVIQGVILGVLGGLVGLAVGAGVCAWLQTIPINRQGFGAMSTAKTLMVSWSAWIYVKAFLITLASAMVSSLLPARQGARLSPIEIIRGAT